MIGMEYYLKTIWHGILFKIYFKRIFLRSLAAGCADQDYGQYPKDLEDVADSVHF